MSAHTILLAETDHRTLNILPRILSAHIPHMAIDICTSTDELFHKLGASSYDTVTMNPTLIRDYRFFTRKRSPQHLPPLIVTIGHGYRTSPYEALEGDAFDVIVKPIVPDQAAQTVKLALAHNTLRRVRASRDRAAARFREHMTAYPHDLKAEERFLAKLALFERTLQALDSSFRLLLNIDEDSCVADMAALVKELTRQQALDRLLSMSSEGLPCRRRKSQFVS